VGELLCQRLAAFAMYAVGAVCKQGPFPGGVAGTGRCEGALAVQRGVPVASACLIRRHDVAWAEAICRSAGSNNSGSACGRSILVVQGLADCKLSPGALSRRVACSRNAAACA
jgi:hypothetical protein